MSFKQKDFDKTIDKVLMHKPKTQEELKKKNTTKRKTKSKRLQK